MKQQQHRARAEATGRENGLPSPDRAHNHDQIDSSSDRGRNKHRDQDGGSPAGDNRRTQSERPAESRKGRPAWSRPINPHVRAAWETTAYVRRKVRAFQREYLGSRSNFNYQACAESLEGKIIPGWMEHSRYEEDGSENYGRSNGGSGRDRSRRQSVHIAVDTYEDFLRLSLRKELKASVASSDEYLDLICIARQARVFDSILPECRERFQEWLDKHGAHLTSLKQFVSLYAPFPILPPLNNTKTKSVARTKDHDASNEKKEKKTNTLNSVTEYDEISTQHAEELETKLNSLKNRQNTGKSPVKPFAEFVRNGESYKDVMSECCKDLLGLCACLDSWARQDDAYPENLSREADSKRTRKDDLQDKIRRTKIEIAERKETISRLKKREGKAAQKYTEFRNIRERLQERLGELQEKEGLLGEKLTSRRKERDELRDKKDDDGNHSPRRCQAVSERIEALDETIEKMEKDLKVTRKQIKRVEQDMKPANDTRYENKVEMVTHRHHKEDIEKEIRRMEAELVTYREHILLLEEEREKLIYIRELKISPEAYRKSLRQMRKQEAARADGTRSLKEACECAAPSLGKQWRQLYLHLPFDPPRDIDRRYRDLAMLETLASRSDLNEAESALRSLNKWQTFHRRGGVPDLTLALRAIKRGGLARKIEVTCSKAAHA